MKEYTYFKEDIVMMNALKEYNEMVWKPSWRWMKKHWKGFSVFYITVMLVEFIWLFGWYDDIKDFIKNKYKKFKGES